jgi:Zn-dependent M28 family amino/carboxypeptidase
MTVMQAVRLAAAGTQDVVDSVSHDSYRSYLGYPGDGGNLLFTHAGDSRYYTAPQHDLARVNIFNHFSALGLATSLDPFTYNSSTYNNVVAVKTGAVRPDDIYILGAHYDSVVCPGADDNASGVAGIMEAARAMSAFDFEATIVFIAFDVEEMGLFGSKAYAGAAKARGDNILGMVSLDMIAHNVGGLNQAEIWGHDTSDPLKLTLAGAVQTYGGLSVTVGGALDYSDHAPFEAQGYEAALLIEADGNPYYHTASDNVDTVGYIDYQFATSMTKGVVGYAAAAAIVVPEPSVVWLFLCGSSVLVCAVHRKSGNRRIRR